MKIKQIVCALIITILASCGSPTPAEVTTELIGALSEGNCDRARELVVDDAFFIVQMIIDGGCMKDVINLKSVTCKENINAATCNCIGVRNAVEIEFAYQLIRKNNQWKVSTWSLDY